MKKLPLALSALAISTVSAAGPASADSEALWPANQGALDETNAVILTKINLRENSISFVVNDYGESLGNHLFDIEGLGAAEKRTYEREHAMDQFYLVDHYIGWNDDDFVRVGLSTLSDYEGLGRGVEVKKTVHPLWTVLANNTSGIFYYVSEDQTRIWGAGKVDYSMCINAATYQAADAMAGDDDVLECRVEADETEVANGEFHYQPYLNGVRLALNGEDGGNGEAGDGGGDSGGNGESGGGSDESDGDSSESGGGSDENGGGGEDGGDSSNSENSGMEENNGEKEGKDGNSDTANNGATSDAAGSMTSDATGSMTSDAYYAYATVTSEGSAYQNSENTGVTDEYATDANVWAVDDSKVWEDGAGAETVETPELGEEDCGHFWPLVAGWGLAVLGWGSAVVLALKKRK